MYQTGYYATGYHETDYYMRGVQVIIPPTGGGGGGFGPPGATHFNQSPSVKAPGKDFDPFLDQALQEDEELMLIFSSFIKVIKQCR